MTKATSSMKHQRTKVQDGTMLMPLKESGQRAVQALPPGRGGAWHVWETHAESPAPEEGAAQVERQHCGQGKGRGESPAGSLK